MSASRLRGRTVGGLDRDPHADVKVLQARLRHASAKTMLHTYAHRWPDSDESTRTAIDAVMQARAEELRDSAAE